MQRILWYFNQGGIVMYPLALVSILSVAVMLERAIRLRFKNLVSPSTLEDVQKHLEAGNIGKAAESCKDEDILLTRILQAAMKDTISIGMEFKEALEEVADRELQVLWNNLSVLRTVARIAPLMGLLGTVMGMIGAFEVLSVAGVGKEEMAAQIRIALITTATGLIVAIPTVIAHAYFSSRIRKILAHLQDIFVDVIKSDHIGQAVQEDEE